MLASSVAMPNLSIARLALVKVSIGPPPVGLAEPINRRTRMPVSIPVMIARRTH
jgi:hypothetical protein